MKATWYEAPGLRQRLMLTALVALVLFSSGALSKEGGKMETLRIKSSAFEEMGSIPRQYTCDGKDVNPPLTIEGVPKAAKSMALIADDPDAPGGTWVHWVLWNIDPTIAEIREKSVPLGAVQGRSDFGKNSYGGPCPPSGVHRYFFKVYALDTMLTIAGNSTKADLERAMKGHVLAEGHLVGVYKRR